MYWKKEFKKGKNYLSERNLKKALKCFESAVTQCPVSSKSGLEKSLFYLGVTLKKLGRSDSAFRCWHIAKELKDNGHSTEMIQRHSNKYGQPVHTFNIEDDKAAFMSIQLEKYIKMKKVSRFCSEVEKDVIKDIISQHWVNLLQSGIFDHMSIDRKLKFFRNQNIIFPVADISYLEKDNEVIYTDFQSGHQLSMNDLCLCGSGILFSQCCGRIKTSEELEVGDF